MNKEQKKKLVKYTNRTADFLLACIISFNITKFIFGPYATRAVFTGNSTDMFGEDYDYLLIYYADKLYEAFPNVDFTTLKEHLKDIKVYTNPDITEIAIGNGNVWGGYDRLNNVISLKDPYNHHVFSHEELHVACNENYFRTLIKAILGTIGIKSEMEIVMEGLTEMINGEVFGIDKENNYYGDEVLWARMICEIVDPNLIIDAYFKGELNIVFDELRKVANDKDDPEKLLALMNKQSKLTNDKNSKGIDIAACDYEITKCFIEMYFNKIKQDPNIILDDPLADIKVNNCWYLITRSLNSLYVYEEFSGAKNEYLYFQLCKTLPDELRYKIIDAITAFDGDNYKERYYFLPEKSTISSWYNSEPLSEKEYLEMIEEEKGYSYQFRP